MSLILNKHGATKELPYKYFGESPFIGIELEMNFIKRQSNKNIQKNKKR